MFFLPQLKCNKGNKVAGENTIDTMVFRNNLLTQHPRILILALLIDINRAVGDEIISSIYNSAMSIKAVSRLVNLISDNVKSRTNRYGYVRALGKKLEEELKKLPASILVLFREITVLSFRGKVVIN